MLSGSICDENQSDRSYHYPKPPRSKVTVPRAGCETHLAGFESKRSRSLLLMDHDRLGTCMKIEEGVAMWEGASRVMRGVLRG